MTRLTIVIADPDPAIRLAFRGVFLRELADVDIRSVCNLDELIGCFSNLSHLDVAIVDMVMDGSQFCRHGLSVLQRIRGKFPDCYNILISSSVAERNQLLHRMQTLPVDYLIAKRFTDRDPIEELRQALRLASDQAGSRLKNDHASGPGADRIASNQGRDPVPR